MAFAREDSTNVESSGTFVQQILAANDQASQPYTFAHGELTMSTGGRFKTSLKNGDLIQAVINQSLFDDGTKETIAETSNVALKLVFENLATSATKSLTIELGGVSLTDHSTSGIEPAEPIFEEVSFKAKSARIVSDHTT